MEFVTFFLGSGMALFISLLAWGDRIRRQQDDIFQLEKSYISQLGKSKAEILPVLREPSRFSFGKQMNAAISLFKQVTDNDREIRKQILSLRKQHSKLSGLFSVRYYSIVALTAVSFLFGILIRLYGHVQIPLWQEIIIGIPRLLMSVYIFLIAYMLCVLVKTSEKEKLFIATIDNALEQLEN